MAKIEIKDLIESGVHFGHLTRKWNPNMAPYVYTERKGIHIIDLYKTVAKIDEAMNALQKIASSGRKILFVATKKQAKDIVAEKAESVNMPYITERWPGGMLTNFITIRKAVKKMGQIDRMKGDGSFDALSKREKLQITRQRAKLEKNLGSITEMTRLPGAILIVDIKREHIAVAEAQKLNIPIFAMVDTNSDPRAIDFVVPSNDDASKSIEKVLSYLTIAVAEGLTDRKNNKEKEIESKAKVKKETKVEETAKVEEAAKVQKPAQKVEEAAKVEKPVQKVEEAAKVKKPAQKVEEAAKVKEPAHKVEEAAKVEKAPEAEVAGDKK